jgi:hypothetical protein
MSGLPAAGEHGGALGAGVLDVSRHRVQLPARRQRPDVHTEVRAGAEFQGTDPAHQFLGEPVVHLLVDVQPLDGDAQLTGVGEAGPHRAVRRRCHVGIGEHHHRVLAAQFQ